MTTETDEKPTEETHEHGPHCDHEDEPGHVHGPECGHEAPKERVEQQVIIVDVGPCRKHIKVIVERKSIDKRYSEKYKELVSKSHIPGFRPGKAPRQIVVRKFQKDVGDEVKREILFASLEQLADEHDIAPLSPPDLNPALLKVPEAGDFVYEFEVEVRPSFDLPEYRGLKLKRPVKTFADDDVAKEENRILSRFGQLVPKDGSVEVGDIVTIDMTTTLGEAFLGAAKELTFRVDDTVTFKDAVAPKFGEQIAGCKAGEQRTIDIQMTEATANVAARGQMAKAVVTVNDVKSIRLPEMTPEFIADQLQSTSLEQFREKIRVGLERRLEYRQRQAAREQVMAHIAAASTWDLPHDLLQRQASRAMARREMEMREAGMSTEEIRARRRMLERDVIASTSASLKEHFVLQKLAEVEKLDVDDDEIQSEIEAIAAANNESPRKLRAQLEREDAMDVLAVQIVERKALDLILENAVYEDVAIAKEGSLGSVDAQAGEGDVRDATAAPPEEPKPAE